MKNSFKISARGQVSIYKRIGKDKLHLVTRSNSVLPAAQTLILAMMAQESDAQPAKIEAYLGNTKKGEAEFTSIEKDNDEGSVTFTSQLDPENLAAGSVDNLRLSPSDSVGLGSYASAEHTIDSTEIEDTLIIYWKITFTLTV